MATSCASESAFSIGGYIDRKNRSRLSGKTLRYSILTKEEEKIVNLLTELSSENPWKLFEIKSLKSYEVSIFILKDSFF